MSLPVTVLMPVYNGADYLEDSIRSVIFQTFEKFELLIIDDGSTDESEAIYSRMAASDSRIKVHRQENGGISSALNKGIELSSGDYIARIDSDDLMLPQRLERQVQFLESNPHLGFCASSIDIIDSMGRVRGQYHAVPSTEDELSALMRHEAVISFTHPTVMMRRPLVTGFGGYDRRFEPCEDTDLFCRMIQRGFPGVAIPEVLVQYRMHDGSISGKQAYKQALVLELIRRNLYNKFDDGYALNPEKWVRYIESLSYVDRWNLLASIKSYALRQSARYDKVSGRPVWALMKLIGAASFRPDVALGGILKRIALYGQRKSEFPVSRWN